MSVRMQRLAASFAGACLALLSPQSHAQSIVNQSIVNQGLEVTFADLADLADSANLIVHAEIAKMARVQTSNTTSITPGFGRFYIQAKTKALLSGNAPLGESISYLVDLPLDSRGKAPKLKKQNVFLFARPVPGRPSELQLITPTAQQNWTPQADIRLRGILQSLLAPDAPAAVTGVRELLFVPGTLAGQGETQIFLNTKDNSAASITVLHEAGAPPRWGASFSELVANVGQPPARDTIEWYRLACFLPNMPPMRANISTTAREQAQALADYRQVMADLGPCPRTLR